MVEAHVCCQGVAGVALHLLKGIPPLVALCIASSMCRSVLHPGVSHLLKILSSLVTPCRQFQPEMVEGHVCCIAWLPPAWDSAGTAVLQLVAVCVAACCRPALPPGIVESSHIRWVVALCMQLNTHYSTGTRQISGHLVAWYSLLRIYCWQTPLRVHRSRSLSLSLLHFLHLDTHVAHHHSLVFFPCYSAYFVGNPPSIVDFCLATSFLFLHRTFPCYYEPFFTIVNLLLATSLLVWIYEWNLPVGIQCLLHPSPSLSPPWSDPYCLYFYGGDISRLQEFVTHL